MLIHWPPDLSGFRFADEDESVVPYWGL
jgi:hypothetical protein